MATTVTHTIRPSGGDYTSLSAWESGEQGDLTGVRDEIAVAECYAMEDTTAVTVDGWTTSSTQYIKITVPTAERHDGKWNTSRYRLVVSATDAYVLQVSEDFARLEGLQIQNTSTGNFPGGVNTIAGAGSVHYISHCISRATVGATTTQRGFNFRAGTTYVWNCLAYDWLGGTTSTGFRSNHTTGNIYCYNCTAHSCDQGFEHPDNGTAMYVKNCLAAGCASAFPAGWNWPTGSDYNATDNAQATTGNGGLNNPPGANSRYSQTFSFVDSANDDWHLTSSDAGAKDFGTDLSADSNLAFSDDVDGQTRSGSWDIGFDEYVAALNSLPPFSQHPMAHMLVR